MTPTAQQKRHLAELLLLETGGEWQVDIITDGSELLAYAEQNGNRCSIVLASSGATYFNGKLLGSSDRFNDLLSEWVCSNMTVQLDGPRFFCRGRA